MKCGERPSWLVLAPDDGSRPGTSELSLDPSPSPHMLLSLSLTGFLQVPTITLSHHVPTTTPRTYYHTITRRTYNHTISPCTYNSCLLFWRSSSLKMSSLGSLAFLYFNSLKFSSDWSHLK